MSEHQISLPDRVYENLLAIAAMEGMTPADWIAAHVPHATAASSQQQSLYDLLADLAGAISDDGESHQQSIKTVVNEAIAAKLAKQGIHQP
ncbi:hypothetical protein [Chroococcidiopsis sp. CCMEE 29]|uniref:hypothetical protein n=1 Tax=Chroococcidiopsis sp. CCMEE 29 TaxID=155894 RepID=UPI002022970C|nr:hypothetical protein [Chroococcidiopsis sp. CCMEE 29]